MRNSVMTFTHLNDQDWSIKFGDFAAEEAPALADNIVEFSESQKVHQFSFENWSSGGEAVVNCLYSRGFIFAEGRNGHGEVVQRAVYKKRAAEEEL